MMFGGGKLLPTTIVQHFKSPLAPLKSLFFDPLEIEHKYSFLSFIAKT